MNSKWEEALFRYLRSPSIDGATNTSSILQFSFDFFFRNASKRWDYRLGETCFRWENITWIEKGNELLEIFIFDFGKREIAFCDKGTENVMLNYLWPLWGNKNLTQILINLLNFDLKFFPKKYSKFNFLPSKVKLIIFKLTFVFSFFVITKRSDESTKPNFRICFPKHNSRI